MEYQEPVIHTYHADSDDESSDSFLSIPDESYSVRMPICPPNPSQKRNTITKDMSGKGKRKQQRQGQLEVFELEVHPRPISPDIAFHNTACEESDVELDIDLEFTPTPVRVAGLKKSKSKTTTSLPHGDSKRKNTSCHTNPAFLEDDVISSL